MNNIVIVGGGFAGIWAAVTAARQKLNHNGDIGIALISANRYLTIRPRLYERDPESLRVPLEPSLEPIGVSLVEGVVREIDARNRTITFNNVRSETGSLAYDRLVLAAGSSQKALPLPRSKEYTWNIDTFEAAVELDRHLRRIMRKPEAACHTTVVIVGGGFTGIELATEMRSRLSIHSDPDTAAKVRVILVEQADVIGPELGANPRPAVELALQRANVEMRTGVRVTQIEEDGVTLSNGARIETNTTIVTAGLRANSLAAELPTDLDELGRLAVDDMLRVKGVADIFAAGDIARARVDGENFALMSCQHAMPMGKFAGYNAARELLGLPLRPYRQPGYVTCLDLGASGALFTTGWERLVKMSGDEGKQMKRKINREWIYPPSGDLDTILAAADIDRRAGR